MAILLLVLHRLSQKFFFNLKSRCHTKRRMGFATPNHLTIGCAINTAVLELYFVQQSLLMPFI